MTRVEIVAQTQTVRQIKKKPLVLHYWAWMDMKSSN